MLLATAKPSLLRPVLASALLVILAAIIATTGHKQALVTIGPPPPPPSPAPPLHLAARAPPPRNPSAMEEGEEGEALATKIVSGLVEILPSPTPTGHDFVISNVDSTGESL